MTFEGGFILIFAFLLGVPVLLVLARLVGWLTGTKTKPVWITLLIALAVPIAVMFYLDAAGTIQPVRITDKRENVSLRSQGQWQRTINITAEYEQPGETLPIQLSMGCDAQTFDELRVGQTVEARILDFGGVFKFARLKHRTALSILTDLFPQTPTGPWQEGIATVESVQHIDKYYARRSHYQYRWPYDVVRLRFQPAGKEQPIVAVDVVESASVPHLAEGQTVKITWPTDDPRSARLLDARPGAPWTNWLYAFGENLVIVALLLLGIIGLSYAFKRRRNRDRPHLPV